MIHIKRAYEPSSRKDGYRVLVDRLWPRGITKQKLALNEWIKDLAPSAEIRKEFAHDPSRWKPFVSAYKKELKTAQAREWIAQLADRAAKQTLTLVYGARDEEHNNAVVLKEILEKALSKLDKNKT